MSEIRQTPGTVVGIADDPKHGMTFGELCELVDLAKANHTMADTFVVVSTTWRSTIKRMEIQGGLPPEMLK